ncbi:MAG: beta-N-acetylhexosaminidase [Paracoccaceae bacterium]
MSRALILAPEGGALTADERAFFRDADPWGFILFRRNVSRPDALRRLTGELRAAVGRAAAVFVDQEGGRVARLGPPHWRSWRPVAEDIARAGDPAEAAEAVRLRYRLIAHDLTSAGIDGNCVPVLDLPVPGADPIIGDRALGTDPATVSRLGRAAADALLAGGVLPVAKHLPGHGRAPVDSHLALPVVDAPRATLAATDFVPFRALADLPLGMTAHVVYAALDDRPATLSKPVIDIIRGEIGFDGLLMTDDLSMAALEGPMGARAEAALAAGCDVILHCNGNRGEMEAIAAAAPDLSGSAGARAARAEAARSAPEPFDPIAAAARYAALMGEAVP